MGEKRKVNFQFKINNTIFLDEEKDSIEEAKRLREEIKNRLFDWPGNFSIDSSILVKDEKDNKEQIVVHLKDQKINNCPFCGRKEVEIENSKDNRYFIVKCDSNKGGCGAISIYKYTDY